MRGDGAMRNGALRSQARENGRSGLSVGRALSKRRAKRNGVGSLSDQSELQQVASVKSGLQWTDLKQAARR